MNLLQIAQKMFEKSISESYLADCCWVSKTYMHNALKGTIPMNQTLEKKIENVIGVIDLSNKIQEKKENDKNNSKVEELKKRKEELGCTYKQLSEHSELGYNQNYLYICFSGKRPITNKMYRDLMKAFDAIEDEQKKPENDETKLVDYGVTLLKDFGVTKKKQTETNENKTVIGITPKTIIDNPFKSMLIDIARAYGKSTHSMEFDAEGYHFVFQLDISKLDG